MIIRYGDSIRAYGLGIVLILLSLGAFWWLLESFTLPRALLAGALACLSVQALYYNAVLLFAICIGASAVTLRRGNSRKPAAFSPSADRGLSLLPYLPINATGADVEFHLASAVHAGSCLGEIF